MILDYEQIKLEIKIDDMIETLKFYAFKNNMIGLREDLDGEIWDTGCRAIETLKYIGIDVESPSYFHDIKNTHALIRRVNSVNDVIRHGIYEDGKEKDRDYNYTFDENGYVMVLYDGDCVYNDAIIIEYSTDFDKLFLMLSKFNGDKMI